MSNQTAITQTTNFLPVQATYEPNYPYNIITFIGPAGVPFYAPINPNISGVNITNSTINSTTIGATTPSTAAFTTATMSNQPVGNTDLANKLYVDAAIVGISWKQPVRAATTGDITLSGAQTIDTVPVVAGDRVLVKEQNAPEENGIYIVGTPWTRSPDADTWDELVSAMVFVESGGLAGAAFYCPIQPGGTLGVTAITWSNFSVAGTYFAGTGLSLAANTFSITNTGVSAATYGSASQVPVFAVNAQGQLTSVTNTNIAIGAAAITSGTIDTARISGTYSGITGVGTLTNLTVTNTITGSISGNAATATSATSATTATNIAGGAAGSIPYQTAAGTTSFIAAGTDGFLLQMVAGVPTWAAEPSTGDVDGPASAVDNAVTRFDGTTGKIIQSSSVSLTDAGGFTNVNEVVFDTTPATITGGVGSLSWNSADSAQTLNLIMAGGAVTQQIGQETYYRVKASATISDGQVVMFTGTLGASGGLKAAPATGLTAATGSYIMGVATENIALNGWGYITAFGEVKGINTTGAAVGETWSDGDILYYNPSVAGGLTKTVPAAPNAKVQVASVIHAASNGILFIRPTFESRFNDLADVFVSSPSNGDLVVWNTTNSRWQTAAQSTVTAGVATNLAGGATGSLPYQSGAGTTTFLAAGTDGQVLKLASGVPTWSSDASGVTIADDTTTNATRYLTFTSATTGSITTENVASTKLQFNPSTGVLTASGFSGSGSNLTNIVTSIFGTTNQITASAATGAVTLSLPQNINTSASVQFGSFGVGTAASGTTGEIRATNNITAYYSSDKKFKENVKPIQNALNIVTEIGGKTFDWTDEYIKEHGGEDGYFVQKHDFGVIAQDVLKLFPVAVRTRVDGSFAVDYAKLSALAFAAISDLKQEIDALRGK